MLLIRKNVLFYSISASDKNFNNRWVFASLNPTYKIMRRQEKERYKGGEEGAFIYSDKKIKTPISYPSDPLYLCISLPLSFLPCKLSIILLLAYKIN